MNCNHFLLFFFSLFVAITVFSSCDKKEKTDPSINYLDGSQLKVDYREKWVGNYRLNSETASVNLSQQVDSAITLSMSAFSGVFEPKIDDEGNFLFVITRLQQGVPVEDTVEGHIRYNKLRYRVSHANEIVMEKLPYGI